MPLQIRIKKSELYDEEKKEFFELPKDYDLILEHSLVSISKWESKFHIPYPYINEGADPMTPEQSNYYIKCMTINKDIPDEVYYCIGVNEMKEVNDYINDVMSATTVKMYNTKKPMKKQILTSELLYYYMFKLGIPKECEKWHINRLIKLIEIFGANESTGDDKKMSRSELAARNKAINARNKAKYHTKG